MSKTTIFSCLLVLLGLTGFINPNPAKKTSAKPRLTVFYADDCGYCQQMRQAIEQNKAFRQALSEEYEVNMVEIHSPAGRPVAQQWNVRSVPAILIEKPGAIPTWIRGFSTLTRLGQALFEPEVALAVAPPQLTTAATARLATQAICGDGTKQDGEQCDDGNTTSGDGCNSTCQAEAGYVCPAAGNRCVYTCGNRTLDPGEQCDDGNTTTGDGCNSTCQVEAGYECPSGLLCRPLCGNGRLDAGEQCDDGNNTNGDGCMSTCQLDRDHNNIPDPVFDQATITLFEDEFIINTPYVLKITDIKDQYDDPFLPESVKVLTNQGSATSILELPPAMSDYTHIFKFEEMGTYTLSVVIDGVEAFKKTVEVISIPELTSYEVEVSPQGVITVDQEITVQLKNMKDQFGNPYTANSESVIIYSKDQSFSLDRKPDGTYVLPAYSLTSIAITEWLEPGGLQVQLQTVLDEVKKTIPLKVQPGSVLYVNERVNNQTGYNGISWKYASPNLQDGLAMARIYENVKEIWVAQGIYKPDEGTGYINNDRNASFQMKNGVTIYGGFPASGNPGLADRDWQANPTFLSGDIDGDNTLSGNSYHIFYHPGDTSLDGSAVLDGFVLTGGNANGSSDIFSVWGGVMFNNNSSPTLTNCTFEGNTAQSGGAIYNQFSSPTLTNCMFEGNSATTGGVMYNNNSSPTLTNCTFEGNTAQSGGAIYNQSSSPSLTNCTLRSNSATGQGGAMYNYPFNTSTLTNCIVWDNGGSNTFVNVENGNVTARYCLFDNEVTNYAGGAEESTNIKTSVLPFASASSLALSPCSPAIDKGDNGANSTAIDLAGQPRRYNGGVVDIGAYEYQGEPAQPVAISIQPPASSTVCVGSRVEVPVGVTGTVTGYQWYKGDQLVQGQTDKTLSLSAVTTADAGSYTLKINSTCNTGESEAFVLTVDPTSVGGTAGAEAPTVCPGTGTTIRLAGYTGSIRWQSSATNNGSDWATINGRTEPTLSTGSLTQTTYYRAVVQSGGCEAATSTVASVSVKPLPTASISGNNGPVCAGQNATFTVSGTSGATLTYTITGQVNPQTLALDGNQQTITAGNAPANVTLTLVSVTKDGCPVSLSASSTVSVKALPVLTSSGNTSVLYGYGSNCATLTATASTGPASLRWSTGATGGSVQVCPTQTTDYAVTALGANGCAASQTLRVTVVDVRCGSGGVRVCLGGREVCVAGYLVATYQRLGATLGGCHAGAGARVGAAEAPAELPLELALEAYPNPTDGRLTLRVRASVSGSGLVEVLDPSGRSVQRRTAELRGGDNELALDVSGQPAGLYVLRVRDAAGRQGAVRLLRE